jgi:hypothetical protein
MDFLKRESERWRREAGVVPGQRDGRVRRRRAGQKHYRLEQPPMRRREEIRHAGLLIVSGSAVATPY